MKAIILFILLCALIYAPAAFGENEAEIDFKKIKRDGSQDTLKGNFHRGNFIKRLFIGLVTAFFAGVSLKVLAGFTWFFCIPYLLYFGSAFNYVFTQDLNIKRGLPAWYVSESPTAANYDKSILKLAGMLGVLPARLNKLLNTVFLSIVFTLLLFWVIIEIWFQNWFLK